MLTDKVAHRLYTDPPNSLTSSLTSCSQKPLNVLAPLRKPACDVLKKCRIGPETYLQKVQTPACEVTITNGFVVFIPKLIRMPVICTHYHGEASPGGL